MVGADNFAGLNEDALNHAFHFALDVVLHLHSLVNNNFLTALNHVAGLNEEFDNGATHRSVESRSCDFAVVGFGCCFGYLSSTLSAEFFGATVGQELLGRQWKELKQEIFFFILSQLHVAELRQFGIFGSNVRIDVVGSFDRSAAYLVAEFGVNRHRSSAVLAEHEVDKLIRLGGVVGFAILAVDSHVNGLSTYNLAGRSNQRHKTCSATHRRNELHGFFEHVFGAESAKVSHHIRIHTTRHFGVLNDFVRLGESEVVFDSVASFEHSFLVVGLSGFDGFVEESIDFGRQSVVKRIERLGEVVLMKVDGSQTLANVEEFVANLAHSFHVTFHFHAEFLSEDVDKFDSRSSRTFGKPPNVGVEDVNAVHNSHHARSQAVAGSTVSVEVDRHVDSSLKFRHQRSHTSRIYQACHILDGNHLGAESFVALSFFYKIFVGKYLFSIYVVVFRINSVAHSTIGYAAKFVDDFYRFLNVVEVVKSIEDTHNAKTILDGFYIETLDDIGGIGCVSE